VSYLVILQRGERILAVEEAGDKEDWPPAPAAICARWLAQGTARDSDRVTVWDEQAGFFYTPVKGVPE
jgi:hypothetical protein